MGLEQEVPDVAQDRDRSPGGVGRQVQQHARDQRLGRAPLPGQQDRIEPQRRAEQIAEARQEQPQQRIEEPIVEPVRQRLGGDEGMIVLLGLRRSSAPSRPSHPLRKVTHQKGGRRGLSIAQILGRARRRGAERPRDVVAARDDHLDRLLRCQIDADAAALGDEVQPPPGRVGRGRNEDAADLRIALQRVTAGEADDHPAPRLVGDQHDVPEDPQPAIVGVGQRHLLPGPVEIAQPGDMPEDPVGDADQELPDHAGDEQTEQVDGPERDDDPQERDGDPQDLAGLAVDVPEDEEGDRHRDRGQKAGHELVAEVSLETSHAIELDAEIGRDRQNDALAWHSLSTVIQRSAEPPTRSGGPALGTLLRISMATTYDVNRGFDFGGHWVYRRLHRAARGAPAPGAERASPITRRSTTWSVAAMIKVGLGTGAAGWLAALLGICPADRRLVGLERWLPESRLARLVALFTAAVLPVGVQLDGMVTNETLSMLLCALAIVALPAAVEGARAGQVKPSAWLGLWIGLALITKISASALLLALIPAVALEIGRSPEPWRQALRVRWKPFAVGAAIIVALSGWFFVRNQILYGGRRRPVTTGSWRPTRPPTRRSPTSRGDRRISSGSGTRAIFRRPYVPTGTRPQSAIFSGAHRQHLLGLLQLLPGGLGGEERRP